jgi:hypothetical protein
MVKIKDLTNQQIVEQLTKYFKFITALDCERKKRISLGEPEEELCTSEELEAKEIAEVSRVNHSTEEGPVPAESTTIFHLKIDDNQLDEIADSSRKGPAIKQVDIKDLLAGDSDDDDRPSLKSEGAFREIESDVTSHHLNLSPKKGKKRIIKKK